MIDLATQELDKQIANLEDSTMKHMMVEMKAKAESSSDLATCSEKMNEHDIDSSCILAADSLDEAQSCLGKRR